MNLMLRDPSLTYASYTSILKKIKNLANKYFWNTN